MLILRVLANVCHCSILLIYCESSLRYLSFYADRFDSVLPACFLGPRSSLQYGHVFTLLLSKYYSRLGPDASILLEILYSCAARMLSKLFSERKVVEALREPILIFNTR